MTKQEYRCKSQHQTLLITSIWNFYY